MVGLDFPLHIGRGTYERIWREWGPWIFIHIYFFSPRPDLQWSWEQLGTITGEAQQCRVAGGQESLAIKQSPQLRKVQNPAIQNAFKGTGQRDRIQYSPWKKLNLVLS
jgi:hypothetical protein